MARKQTYYAIICGVIAAVLLGVFLMMLAGSSRQQYNNLIAQYGGDTVEACVAARSQKSGVLLKTEDFAFRKWPVVLLPEGALTKGDVLKIQDRRLTIEVVKGEVLTLSHFKKARDKNDVIANNMTAVTLETDTVRALGGEIKPGMRVTVMSTQDALKTVVLAQDVEVLSSNKQEDQEKSGSLIGGSNAEREMTWVTLAIPNPQVRSVVAASVADAAYLVMPKNPRATLKSELEHSNSDDSKGTSQSARLFGGDE